MSPILALLAAVLMQSEQEAYKPTGVNMGLGAIVPGDVAYRPLTGKERWKLFGNTTAGNPGLYFRATFVTIPEHLHNTPAEWGQGWGAYGQRVGSRMALITVSAAIEEGGNALLRQDPRYVSCRQCDSKARRLKHSLIYTFLTYDQHGKPAFNYGNLAGQLGSEMIASTWIPGRTWKSGLGWGMAEQAGFNWLANVAREFSPEIKRLFRKKK